MEEVVPVVEELEVPKPLPVLVGLPFGLGFAPVPPCEVYVGLIASLSSLVQEKTMSNVTIATEIMENTVFFIFFGLNLSTKIERIFKRPKALGYYNRIMFL